MKWNRELNPLTVGVVCLVVSLVVIDQSIRLVFRPVGRASAEAVIVAESLLAGLPTENLYQRLSAIKASIRELETEKEALQRGLPSQSKTSRVRNLQGIGEIERALEVLREEETKTINDIASNPDL